jgi:DNA helicase II / ATP-dependent DNA helicase PcrA
MNSEPRTFRVVGPPGCGKTTYLSRMAGRAVALSGPHAVYVVSLTRTAAAEAAGRHLPIARSNVGTMHAMAYRALNAPGLTADQDAVQSWNTWVRPRAPGFVLHNNAKANDDLELLGESSADGGDGVLQQVDTLRARMVPKERWPQLPTYFARLWTEWKQGEGLMDFTDLIETALTSSTTLPGAFALLVDEAQDSSSLELALARHWGAPCDIFAAVGDPMQAIYGWRGASPEAFWSGDVESEVVLGQSYRVPRTVRDAATAWIERSTNYRPAEYLPRDAEGEVRRSSLSLSDAERLADAAGEDAAAGKSVMVLASCGYMLTPLLRRLREIGQPFGNPWRRNRGDWNPLAPSKGTAAKDRLLALLVERDDGLKWTPSEALLWAPLVRAGVWRKGTLEFLKALPQERADGLGVWEERLAGTATDWPYLVPEELLDAFEAQVLPSKKHSLEFPLRVTRRRGVDALSKEPRITVGTVHSCKGGEADVVYLAPDLSPQGSDEWSKPGSGKDAVRRVFYVGMTRAKEKLVLLSGSGRWEVSW